MVLQSAIDELNSVVADLTSEMRRSFYNDFASIFPSPVLAKLFRIMLNSGSNQKDNRRQPSRLYGIRRPRGIKNSGSVFK